MAKPIEYKEEDGTKYKISYSEELQLKNLAATKEQTFWLRKNFYMMLLLMCLLLGLTLMVFAVIYWVDTHDIITRVIR